jgi:hypothetical protein
MFPSACGREENDGGMQKRRRLYGLHLWGQRGAVAWVIWRDPGPKKSKSHITLYYHDTFGCGYHADPRGLSAANNAPGMKTEPPLAGRFFDTEQCRVFSPRLRKETSGYLSVTPLRPVDMREIVTGV